MEAIENSKYKLLYSFLLSTGLRIGEALALKHSDVDYEKHTVTVSKDVVFIKGFLNGVSGNFIDFAIGKTR